MKEARALIRAPARAPARVPARLDARAIPPRSRLVARRALSLPRPLRGAGRGDEERDNLIVDRIVGGRVEEKVIVKKRFFYAYFSISTYHRWIALIEGYLENHAKDAKTRYRNDSRVKSEKIININKNFIAPPRNN